jgi:hypothetical protein
MTPPKYYVTCSKDHTAEYTLRPYASDWQKINCVPFVTAMGGIGACAQYSAMLFLKVQGLSSATVPELTLRAKKFVSGGMERSTGGWRAEEISYVLENEGFNCFLYSRHVCDSCGKPLEKVKCGVCDKEFAFSQVLNEPTLENIYAYVESGIPVLIGVKKAGLLPWWNKKEEEPHALVAVGHTLSEDGNVDGLIIHDVSKYPYKVLTNIAGGKPLQEIIIAAIAPLPREITVRYQIARQAFHEVMSKIPDLNTNWKYRPMLLSSSKIHEWLSQGVKREHLDKYEIFKKVREDFSRAYFDKYNWLFEITEIEKGKMKYIGDVACSAVGAPIVLALHLPSRHIYWYRSFEKIDKLIRKKLD